MNVPVVRIGRHAARFLTRYSRAQVAAVFERSLHLEASGDFLCVGGPGIGNGPLNAIVEAPACAELLASLTAGSFVAIRDGAVHIAGFRLDARDAKRWQPSVLSGDAQVGAAARGARSVSAIAGHEAPADGLSRLAFGLDGEVGLPGVLARVAAPHLAELSEWVARRLETPTDGGWARLAPCGLLGMGPGLTPSGDDLICGVLIALSALGRGEVGGKLALAVDSEAPRRTTSLSGAFLRAAGDGQGSEVLHETIAAMIRGDGGKLPLLVRRLGEVGHTSGWDALAGAWLAITAWAEASASMRSRG